MYNSFKEVREYLDSKDAIRFKGHIQPPESTLEKFVREFFRKYNIDCPTIYHDSNVIQTPKGKRRSIGDIYRIAKFYYPETKLSEVYELLFENIRDNGFFSYICHLTGLRVYRDNTQDVYGGGNFFNGPFTDEYKVALNKIKIIKELPHNIKGSNDEEDDKFIKYIDIR